MRFERLFQRRPCRHSVQMHCQVVRERDFRLVADRVENLSTWGMLVTPSDPVVTGERVFVSFQLPGTDTWMDACATVTRVIHGRRPGETARKLGLEFDPLSQYDRFKLRRALRQSPPKPPGPRAGRRFLNFDVSSFAIRSSGRVSLPLVYRAA